MKLTSERPGFTLIELLVVVVVIGILAVISLYQTDQVSRRANIAAMQQDLRAVLVHQEMFHQMNMRYATAAELTEYTPTEGVTLDVPWVQGDGFVAITTHIRLPANSCAVYMGPAPDGSHDPATEPGTVTCDYESP